MIFILEKLCRYEQNRAQRKVQEGWTTQIIPWTVHGVMGQIMILIVMTIVTMIKINGMREGFIGLWGMNN